MKTIHPESRLFHVWTGVALCAVLYNAITIPIRIAFGAVWPNWALLLDATMDGILMADVFLHIHTGFVREGVLIMDQRATRREYLKTGGKWDITAIIPVDFLLLFLGFTSPITLAIARSTRLLRVVRLVSIFTRWEKGSTTNPGLIRMLKLLITVAVSNHLIACIWYFIGSRVSAPQDSWLAALGLIDSPMSSKYLHAFYWSLTTMTTVGYGDITPQNDVEVLFTLIVLMIGVALFAYIIGNIASLIANLDSRRAMYRQKMEAINKYMEYRTLPRDLRQRVRRYYEYLWSLNKGIDEDTILQDLPPELSTEIALYLNGDIIEKVPLFKGSEPEFIRAIVTKLKARVCGPSEFINRKGEVGDEMFFISKGEVVILDPDTNTVISTLRDGDFFGEIALLYTHHRLASVQAITPCHLFVLHKEDLQHLLETYPNFATTLHKNAREAYRLSRQEIGNETLWRPGYAVDTSSTQPDSSSLSSL